ncbi:MAG TPA: TlpA disulfide reductase family protein [Burkholderiales bacterium]|nr:TlpA disulfide reductase family protein [Burkholderiales bacterium]
MKEMLWSMIFLLFLPLSSSAADKWSLTDTDGKVLQLSDYKGKWVMVNFWATWCPPCQVEIPGLNAIKGEKIAVIGVVVSYTSPEEVSNFMKLKQIGYPVILGNEDIAAIFGGIDSLPTSFLYSPEGKLVGKHEGPLTQTEISKLISTLR